MKALVGTDLTSVDEIEVSVQQFGDRFLKRIYTTQELLVAGRSPQRLATRFAAKEASIKALDLCDVGVDWRNIEVTTSGCGRPDILFHGNVEAHARSLGVASVSLSLSHEGDAALAFVVLLVQESKGPYRVIHRRRASSRIVSS